jgi:hypothetical protein
MEMARRALIAAQEEPKGPPMTRTLIPRARTVGSASDSQ